MSAGVDHGHEHAGHGDGGHGHAGHGGGGHGHGGHGHSHSHGLIDRSIARSRDGMRTVAVSLAVLLVTALLQVVVYATTGSVALLADLIHNTGDALTAIPLGIAFALRSYTAEKRAGWFVVLAIFVSGCVAGVEAVDRLLHPRTLDHLVVLAAAGVVGFVGNEIAAQVRLRGGRRLRSPALIADGYHSRTDGFVSLAVVASAAAVALGAPVADPIIGLVITLVILRVTWQSILTIREDPAPPDESAPPAAPGTAAASGTAAAAPAAPGTAVAATPVGPTTSREEPHGSGL